MKPFLLISVIFLFVACKDEKSASNVIWEFDPVPGKIYSMEMKTVSTHHNIKAVSGDTLLFEFDLVPRTKDSMGNRMVLLVRKLRFLRSPDNALGQRPDKAGVPKQVSRKKNVPDFVGMMKAHIMQTDRILNAVTGDSLLLIVNTSGQLVKEYGYESLVNRVAKQTTTESAAVRRVLEDYLGAAAMQDFIRQLLFYLPVKPIKTKDSWVSNIVYNAMAPVKHSNLIIVDTVAGNKVLLSINAMVTAGEGEIYMKGTKSGFIQADIISGFPLQMRLNEESTIITTGGDVKKTKSTSVDCIIR
jgi:hypothetical protein